MFKKIENIKEKLENLNHIHKASLPDKHFCEKKNYEHFIQ